LKPWYRTSEAGKIFLVAFTPKGGCPLKRVRNNPEPLIPVQVAFTPKGGCPLKLVLRC